ncbi:MAG: VCBS domain-containing protein [Pseudomonadaceae bacterium]|nr:VCBS domain-containing protein [Pseudomonadaceae bacterium]
MLHSVFAAADDKGGFDSGRVNINVVSLNQAPETNALNISGDEDTLITINLAGSDSDGSIAGYVIKSLPTNGLFYSDTAMTTLIAVDDLVTGPVYFKPNANWNGASQFNYAARDNEGLTDPTPALANITVTAAPDAAEVGSGAATVKEDTPAQSTAAGTLSITDPDAGEEGFEVQSNTAGTYGSFSITSDGDWTYNIDNSKTNVQQLKEGETKTETFTVNGIDGTASSVVITVTGTNDGPTAAIDSGATQRNIALTFTPAQLLGNDTDPDGDTLTIDSVQGAMNGNVALVAGNVVFVPTTGYSGPASFSYTIIDGKGGASTASVNINVSTTPPPAADGTHLIVPSAIMLLGGADALDGGDEDDYLDGGDGDDIGPANAALLLGGAGNDIIFGDAGSEDLDGGIGNDTLMGGAGNDHLKGGDGADLFKWRAGDTGQDVILDVNLGEGDRIDLRDLLVNEQNNEITDYLRLDTITSTLQISSTGQFGAGGTADVTIKLENGAGGNALSDYNGMSQAQIINSLIGSTDPMLKVDQG